MADIDSLINKTPPSLAYAKEALKNFKCGKAAGVCYISAEILKAGDEAMVHGLHTVVSFAWKSDAIPLDWKRELVVPVWKRKEDRQDCNSCQGNTLLSVPCKLFTYLLLM